MADLDESIGVTREAVKATPDDHSNPAMHPNNLGLRLGDRFSLTTMADLQEAKQNFRTALNSQNASITIRIGADRCFMSTPDILEDAPLACDIAKANRLDSSFCFWVPLHPQKSSIFFRDSWDSRPMPQQLHCMLIKRLVFDTELLETGRAVLASFLQDMRADITNHLMMVGRMLLIRSQISQPVCQKKKIVAIPSPEVKSFA